MNFIFIIIAITIGGFFSLQGSLNATLGFHMQNHIKTAFINFFVGAVTLLIINILFSVKIPSIVEIMKIPPYLFIGGIIGALSVTLSIFIIPKIGITTFLGAIISGQMISAAIIDQYGLFHITVHPISINRILGIICLLGGIFLIQKF